MAMTKKRGLLCVLFGLALAMAVCLLPGMSQTAHAVADDIWIGETHVTDSGSGNGWSYDATSHTLTLSGYSNEGKVHKWGDNNFYPPEFMRIMT